MVNKLVQVETHSVSEMAYPLPPTISSAFKRRPEIESVLTCAVNREFREKATAEYTDLLSTEHKFSKEDKNTYSSICRRVAQQSVPDSYTSYGNELAEKYSDSDIITLINAVYQKYRGTNEKIAMKEFHVLKEVSFHYALRKKNSQGLSQTVHERYQNIPVSSQQLSKTVNPKNLATDSGQKASVTNHLVVMDDQTIMLNGRKFYSESMYHELQNHAKILEKDIRDLQNELKQNKQEVDDLRSRLSGFASRQLTEGNPDFTDLSDKNRPSVIAEKFHSVYDDEWTSCLESLTHSKKGSIYLSEEEAVSLLMDIIKRCFAFCTNYTEKQNNLVTDAWNRSLQDPFTSTGDLSKQKSSDELPDVVINELKRRRRQNYEECIKNACQTFKANVLKADSKLQTKMVPSVEAYADKCVEIIWLMTVQDPPMHLCWPEEKDKFDSELYKEYGKKGKQVKMAVWPAVLIQKNGAVMYKGFAMPL